MVVARASDRAHFLVPDESDAKGVGLVGDQEMPESRNSFSYEPLAQARQARLGLSDKLLGRSFFRFGCVSLRFFDFRCRWNLGQFLSGGLLG